MPNQSSAVVETYVSIIGDIDITLGKTEYVDRFRSLCKLALTSPKATYVFMERYAYINGFAGSAVALLAGNLGYERELFLDSCAESNSDRGMMIASKIFAATIDEHGALRGKAPHRNLAQACLEAVARACNVTQAERKLLDAKSDAFLATVRSFKANYAGEPRTLGNLVRSVGYHVASEYLADHEYQIMDEEIWFGHPDDHFRAVVRRTQPAPGQWGGPWMWVTVHGHYGVAESDEGYGVEHDHFEYAMEAVDLVEHLRPRTIELDICKQWATEGLMAFKTDLMTMFDAVDVEIGELSH